MSLREAGRLDGNRIWRVSVPGGTVLQKLYGERGSWLAAAKRELGSRLRGGKTSTRAAARRATEARLLRLWREAGLEVPADLSAVHPELANARTLVLEDVPGVLLSEALVDPALPPGQRDELLRRFARACRARHDLALARGEAGLIQEHGTVQHVIVSGERLVSFDLENAFLPRRDLRPLLAKEIASILRSLARLGDEARFRRDLAVVVSAYGDLDRLRDAARFYLQPSSLRWRIVWALDRLHEEREGKAHGKYRVLRALRDATAG